MTAFSEYDEATVVDAAQADPTAALSKSQEILAAPGSTTHDRTLALWARGVALRELAELGDAERALLEGERLASSFDPTLAARISLTLALVVMYLGDSVRALEILSKSEEMLEGEERGRMLLQRGLVLHRSGDLVAAREAYGESLEMLEDDEVSVIRLFLNLAVLDVYEGSPHAAAGLLEEAYRRADRVGQNVLAASAVHNLGYALAGIGDVVGALDKYDEAERRFQEIGGSERRVAIVTADRAATLLDANLLDAAAVDALEAMDVLRRGNVQVEFAETALLAARVRFALGDHDSATRAAAVARESFADAERLAWLPLIRLLEVRIAFESGTLPPSDIAPLAQEVATELRALRWHRDADVGFLLAGRCLLSAGLVHDARRILSLVGEGRSMRAPVEVAALHLARALIAQADGDAPSARRSVSAGLSSLWQGQIAASHYELRAHAASHAEDLGRLGARLAVADGRAREFIRRVEVSRMIANTPPMTRPPVSVELASTLEELRTVTSRLGSIGPESEEGALLAEQQQHLERSVVRASRRRRGSNPGGEVALAESIAELDGRTLVFQYELDETMWTAVVSGGRASLSRGGRAVEWREASADQHFGLNRLQRVGVSEASSRAGRQIVAERGEEMASMLPAAVTKSDRPLVVVPSYTTADVCWNTIPALTGRPIAVAASVGVWAAAVRRRPGAHPSTVVLVGGPDLDHAGEELRRIVSECEWAEVHLPASIDELFQKLGDCEVLHLACHGRFRIDNPLFSSLQLADGELNFYDLEQCERLPHTVVMSACNAGQNAVLEGGALLGMASALIQLGVSSVIAPLTPVNDQRSVDLMVRLHTHLAAGVEPAEALALASVGPDGELDPTAAPFICFGS